MKKTILSISLFAMMSGTSLAATLEETIASLKADGFTISEVNKTFLGNYKIEARKGSMEREVIYSEFLNKVLRDRSEDDHNDGSDDRRKNIGDDSDDGSDDDHGSDDHGNDDHGSDDHGNDDHGSDDHGSDDHGSDDHGSDDHGSDDHDD